MSRACLIGGVAAALALASSAAAQPVSGVTRAPAAAESAPKGVTVGDPDRQVCKTLKSTGSRLAKAKVCKTAREWAEQQHEHQKELDKLQVPRTPDAG